MAQPDRARTGEYPSLPVPARAGRLVGCAPVPAARQTPAREVLTLPDAARRAVRELMRVSPVTDPLAGRFAAAGYELYLVGGSVRDALLGRLGDDLDFTTSA